MLRRVRPLIVLLVICLLLSGQAATAQEDPMVPVDNIAGPAQIAGGELATFTVTTAQPGTELRITNQDPNVTKPSDVIYDYPDWIFIRSLKADGACSIDDQGSLLIVSCGTRAFELTLYGNEAQRLWLSAGTARMETFIEGATPGEPTTTVWIHGTDQNVLLNQQGEYNITVWNSDTVTRTFKVDLYLTSIFPRRESLTVTSYPSYACIMPFTAVQEAEQTAEPQDSASSHIFDCTFTVPPNTFSQHPFGIRWLYAAEHTLEVYGTADGSFYWKHRRQFSVVKVRRLTPYSQFLAAIYR